MRALIQGVLSTWPSNSSLIDASEATLLIPGTKRAHKLRSPQRLHQLDGRNLPVLREYSPLGCLCAILTATYSSANRARTRSVSVANTEVDSVDTDIEEPYEKSSEDEAPRRKAPKRSVTLSRNPTTHFYFVLIFTHQQF